MTRYTTHGRRWAQQRELARVMRRDPTPEEDLLWQQLRDRRLGAKFRRQHPVARFILDFYAVDAGLAIEVDGPIHRRSASEDARRQAFLEEREISFLRVTNDEIRTDMGSVIARVREAIAQRQARDARGG